MRALLVFRHYANKRCDARLRDHSGRGMEIMGKLHGCYKDTSDSTQAAAICFGGIVVCLLATGVWAVARAIWGWL